MIGVKFDVRDASLRRTLKRLPTALESELHSAMTRFATDHIESMTRKMRGDGEGLVKTRTGFLRDRMTYETRRQGGVGGLRTRVFVAGVKYANVQEFGGTIKPVRSKYLTVPMDSIKNPSGTIKGRYSGGARSYMNSAQGKERGVFVWRNALGGAFIAEKANKKGQLRLLWKLVRQVKIKGNLGWFATWRKGADSRRVILQQAADRAVARSTR